MIIPNTDEFMFTIEIHISIVSLFAQRHRPSPEFKASSSFVFKIWAYTYQGSCNPSFLITLKVKVELNNPLYSKPLLVDLIRTLIEMPLAEPKIQYQGQS